MMPLSSPGQTALNLNSLNALNFSLDDYGMSWFIKRPKTCGGMCYFAGFHTSDFFTGEANAAIAGLAIAQGLLADEATRLALGAPVLWSTRKSK